MLQKGVFLKYSMKWGIVEGDLPTTSSDNAIKEGIRYYFKDKIPKVLREEWHATFWVQFFAEIVISLWSWCRKRVSFPISIQE